MKKVPIIHFTIDPTIISAGGATVYRRHKTLCIKFFFNLKMVLK